MLVLKLRETNRAGVMDLRIMTSNINRSDVTSGIEKAFLASPNGVIRSYHRS